MGEFFQSIGNFFKSITSAGATITNIVSFILGHLIYLLAGAVVAFVILLIWSLCIKKMPNWIICVLVAIACIGGAFGIATLIEKNQQKNNADIPYVYPENAPVTIDGDKYLKAIGNGGYSYEKLKQLLADPSTPTHDDRYLDLKIAEYNDIAVVSYDKVISNVTYTINVFFDKIDDKWAFSGCMNFRVNRESGAFWWITYEFENKMWLGDNFSPLKNKLGKNNGLAEKFAFSEEQIVQPRYYSKTHDVNASQLTGSAAWGSWVIDAFESTKRVKECAAKGSYDVLQNYFVAFEPFNIMTHKNKVETDLNAFYSAVFNQASIAGDKALIDVSAETVVIDGNKQVYKGKNYIRTTYKKFDTNAYATNPADSAVQLIKETTLSGDTKTFESKPEIQIMAKITNDFVLENIPQEYLDAIIQLTNKDTGEVKQYKFDTTDSFKNGFKDNLDYGKYDYVIVSKYLDFATNQGELEIKQGDTQATFDFEYKSDIVNLTITFENTGDSTLADFDINAQPVSILLTNTENGNKETFVFNTQQTFEKGMTKAIKIGTYNLEVISEGLKFQNIPTQFELTVDQHKLTFEYFFKVNATINVSPKSADVDFSTTDLSNYPVRVVLTSADKTRTYQFTFDSQNKINLAQTELIECGTYTFNILSERLVFDKTSGSLEITPQNKNFDFEFGTVQVRFDLKFTLQITQLAKSESGSVNFIGKADSDSVSLLNSKLNEPRYYVNTTIFDDDGKIVATDSHHHGGGTCSFSFSANLIDGQNYTVQLTYANGADLTASNYVEYQGAVASFTYSSQRCYRMTYSCTEA